jgi:hypothetical protein
VLSVGALLLLAGRAAPISTAAPGTEPEDFWLGIREQTCERNEVEAVFYIPPLSDGARFHRGIPSTPDETWIDLSLFDNGFRQGTFLGLGPLASLGDHRAVTWSGLRPDLMHFYRINARVGSRWYEVASGRFETPDCGHVMRMACDEQNGVAVTFGIFTPGNLDAGQTAPIETWLDLTLRGDGYPRGTFIGAGPFLTTPGPDRVTTFEWRDLRLFSRHYWRTNTLFRTFGWVVMSSGDFLTPDCNSLLRVP